MQDVRPWTLLELLPFLFGYKQIVHFFTTSPLMQKRKKNSWVDARSHGEHAGIAGASPITLSAMMTSKHSSKLTSTETSAAPYRNTRPLLLHEPLRTTSTIVAKHKTGSLSSARY